MWKVAARHQTCHLLNNTILNYPLKSPDLHILSQLQNRPLGREKVKVSSAPPVMKLTYSVFKSTRILKNAIVKLDDLTSCNRSTGYSYWCSHLKRRTRIPRSLNHVPYSVTLGTKGQMISCLPTRAQWVSPRSRRPPKPGCSTLYYFRSLFYGP